MRVDGNVFLGTAEIRGRGQMAGNKGRKSAGGMVEGLAREEIVGA